ncbi:HotDog domain-containing protein [Rhodocollybia butyracea]|uniref:HotDog domain-containing protein n=1 Tax=Rhodocollybia butyracea TaxID=206335 RepID=A0A9P5Q222_9AGAR|nr:HotDog domain-containing protein [Rhodocollybia butyracea]
MSSATNDIAGNASEEVKDFLKHTVNIFTGQRQKTFASSVLSRLILTEASLKNNAVEPQRKDSFIVYKITVDEDMINGGGNIHGGCSALLIDCCSSAAIIAMKLAQGAMSMDVSQSMNIIYHAPAAIGEVLRIVNTTMTMGKRITSARTEIWSETHHRLVASGTHIKMEPSAPTTKL